MFTRSGSKLKRFSENDKYETLENIKYVSETIIKRLYSSFDSIEEESKSVEEKAYKESSAYFDPDTMDETLGMDEAYHEGVNHYLVHTQMKQEFLIVRLHGFFISLKKTVLGYSIRPMGTGKRIYCKA